MNAVTRSGSPEAASPATAIACYHCGDEVPEQAPVIEAADEAPKHFCCEGCRTAYRIISAGGLEGYYRHREEYGTRPAVSSREDDTESRMYDLYEAKQTPAEDGSIELVLRVEGIHCASCVWLNEKILNSLPGVVRAEVRLGTNRAYLTYDPAHKPLREIAAQVARVGYRLIPMDARDDRAGDETRDLLTRMGVAGFFAGNMMLVSVALYAGYFDSMERMTRNLFHLVSFLFAAPVLLYSARVFFRGAWAALRHGAWGMDLLLSAGVSLAFGYSIYSALFEVGEVYFDSITFVVFAVLTGRFLESRLRQRSMQQVENLRAAGARVVFLEGEESAPGEEGDANGAAILAADVKAGQCIRVPAGDPLPADGELLSPRAELDESLLTGEYRPVPRRAGDQVLAGSRAVGSSVLLRAARDYSSSTLAKLHDLVEAGLRETSPVDELAAAAGRWFVAFVLLAGFATLSFWFYQGDGARGIHSTIALLIVACPCALSLAIPIARVVALQAAFRNGCLVKNGSALDDLAGAQVLALDKTGTLTGGRPRIGRIEIRPGSREKQKETDELLALARALQNEAGARHPVAEAFRAARAGNESFPVEIAGAEYIPGQGVRGQADDREYVLGSRAWMRSLNVAGMQGPDTKDDESPGSLPVYLAGRSMPKESGPEQDFQLQAVFFLEDELREEAPEILRVLTRGRRKEKLHPVLLTGDLAANARHVAGQVGITEILAEQTPAEKLNFIRQRREQARVCMVGDGINDAAALAAADVGVSFADASEISLYSADVLLLKNDLRQLEFLFRLARGTRRKMIQNLALAFAYNSVLIPLACLGFIVPVLGAGFMALSSLTVVANSLLLRG